MSIPVICDRCRSTGIAGESDFSHLGDLLEFEPVPRAPRPNGWTPEAQRAFIAILSATGSKAGAAKALNRNAYGIDQLLKDERGGSFRLAFERAKAIARQNGAMKIASGLADTAARNAQLTPPSRLRGLAAAEDPNAGYSDDQKWQLLQHLAMKFFRKVSAEREARLAGEIVAADFYLRQITFLEVIFDLTAQHFGWDSGAVLRDIRKGGFVALDIVSTPFTDRLDYCRREYWRDLEDPERPLHPDPSLTIQHGGGPWGPRGDEGFATAVDQGSTGATTTPARGYSAEQWARMNNAEQHQARKQQFAEDAAEQIAWEAKASVEWQARQTPSPPRGEGRDDGA